MERLKNKIKLKHKTRTSSLRSRKCLGKDTLKWLALKPHQINIVIEALFRVR